MHRHAGVEIAGFDRRADKKFRPFFRHLHSPRAPGAPRRRDGEEEQEEAAGGTLGTPTAPRRGDRGDRVWDRYAQDGRIVVAEHARG